MQDVLTRLTTLKRPRLLIRTARIGAPQYRRTPHLHRLLGYCGQIRSSQAILRLMDIEHDLNEKRKTADASYSVSRHIDVLIALMGEAQSLQEAAPTQV